MVVKGDDFILRFKKGERIEGRRMKEFIKRGIYFASEGGTKLYDNDIKDTEIYEYIGTAVMTGEGEKYYMKMIGE